LNVTIKMSGHILFPSLGAATDLKPYVNLLKDLKKLGYNVYVVVGGGEPARYYIRLIREQGADESTCDQMGISIANLNAKVFAQAMGSDACQFIPKSFSELDHALETGKMVFMGGLQPGQSTNAVSCVLAERSKSKLLINTTTVDAIYTSDPKTDHTAKKLSKITIAELAKLLDDKGTKAGEYDLLDPVAIKIIQRSKITTKIIDGRDPISILKAIKGEDIGTTIIP